MSRDREQTTREILNAVGALLSRSGFRALGVNAVAREAGVDKVLIYRYFGGLPELLEAFAEKGDFWPSDDELLGPGAPATEDEEPATEVPDEPAEVAAQALTRFARALRRRPTTQEILRWELLEQNELTEAMAKARERQGMRLLQRLPASAGVDLPAVLSILAAGLTYLVIRSKTAATYNGVDLRSESGFRRLEEAAALLMRLALNEGAQPPARRGSRGASR